MFHKKNYVQPQLTVVWLKTEGCVCEATSSGSGFENFMENEEIVW